MTCTKIRRCLPGYLDGGLQASEYALVRAHLQVCTGCRQELEQYRKLSVLLSRAERVAAPADLAVRIRVAVSHARSAGDWTNQFRGRIRMILENVLEPIALSATGGVAAALLVFAFFIQLFVVGIPVGSVPNDLPTALQQPARLESLAPFPVPAQAQNDGAAPPDALLVEATVNSSGEVVNYQILAGPRDLAVRRQLDQVLLFSRFRPMMRFGQPAAGGRVVLSFSEVRVKG